MQVECEIQVCNVVVVVSIEQIVLRNFLLQFALKDIVIRKCFWSLPQTIRSQELIIQICVCVLH